MTPDLEFNLPFTVLPQTYNYCHIPQFQRYYFINNWTYVGRLWVASCVVDVLATYRTEIRNSQQYVLRSASSSDGTITDTLYPIKNNYTLARHNIDMGYAADLSLGTYIVGIINGDDDAIGCISYYYMSQTQFDQLKAYLLKPVSGTTLSAFLTDMMGTVTDISEGAVKALFNPLQYIASCTWVPYILWHETPPAGTWVDNLPFGWWTLTGVSAERIQSSALRPVRTVTVTLGQHPQVSRGSYLNAAPFTDYCLYLPPFGSVPLDGAICHKLDNRSVTIRQTIDLITGNCVGEVIGTIGGVSVNLCPIMQAPLSLPIQLSQVSMNLAGDWQTTAVAVGADTIASMLGGGLSDTSDKKILDPQTYWNPISGYDLQGFYNNITKEGTPGNTKGKSLKDRINTLASNVASAAKASMTQLMSTGVNGNLASLLTPAFLLQIFYTVLDDDNSHRGRPYCQKVTLSSLTGYVLIADPDISLAAPETEIGEIKDFMTTGMYLQ